MNKEKGKKEYMWAVAYKKCKELLYPPRWTKREAQAERKEFPLQARKSLSVVKVKVTIE